METITRSPRYLRGTTGSALPDVSSRSSTKVSKVLYENNGSQICSPLPDSVLRCHSSLTPEMRKDVNLKNITKSCRKPQTPPHDDYYIRNRNEQTTIFRFRRRHSRLYKVTCMQSLKLAIQISLWTYLGTSKCLSCDTLRCMYWPSKTSQGDKLLYSNYKK